MIEQLRQTLRALERPAGMDPEAGFLPLGIPAIDAALGGGLTRGALHEIAAAGEAHIAAAAGFAVGMACLQSGTANSSSPLPSGERSAHEVRRVRGNSPIESHLPPHPNPLPPGERESRRIRGMAPATHKRNIVWIAEDMALSESGAPYGPGLETFGLCPEQLLTVAAAHRRDLLWAMEEALRCRAVSAAIGELRGHEIDGVAVRRLSLAASESGALALLLRASPPIDASTAATRWIVSAAPSVFVIPGRPPHGLTPASRNDEGEMGGEKSPCFAVRLTRNRRGPLGSWMLQWSDDDERFVLATPAQPVAAPAADRPHREVA